MIYTKISLKKLQDNPKPGDKMPSHALIAATDDYKEKATVGKLWMKTGDFGVFLSGETTKEYTNEAGATFDGYVILSTKEYKQLLANKPSPSFGKNGEVSDPSGIEF